MFASEDDFLRAPSPTLCVASPTPANSELNIRSNICLILQRKQKINVCTCPVNWIYSRIWRVPLTPPISIPTTPARLFCSPANRRKGKHISLAEIKKNTEVLSITSYWWYTLGDWSLMLYGFLTSWDRWSCTPGFMFPVENVAWLPVAALLACMDMITLILLNHRLIRSSSLKAVHENIWWEVNYEKLKALFYHSERCISTRAIQLQTLKTTISIQRWIMVLCWQN